MRLCEDCKALDTDELDEVLEIARLLSFDLDALRPWACAICAFRDWLSDQ